MQELCSATYLSSDTVQFHQLWSSMFIRRMAQVVQIVMWGMLFLDQLSCLGDVCCPISKPHLSQSCLNIIASQWLDTWKIMICTFTYLLHHISNHYPVFLSVFNHSEQHQVRLGLISWMPLLSFCQLCSQPDFSFIGRLAEAYRPFCWHWPCELRC